MADYTPYEWECGDAISAAQLNHIERGIADVNGDYVPYSWVAGDPITASKLNHIEQGIADVITPSGVLSIASNGIYDITSFASVDVDVQGGGGGDHDAEDGIITREISGAYENSRVTSIGIYAFYSCSALTTASFPNATYIGFYAFQGCSSLTTASFPNATYIGSSAFNGCPSLTTVSFPSATSIGAYAFFSCDALTTASFPNATYIGSSAFNGCTSLTTVSFPSVTSIGSNAFNSCKALMSAYFLASSIATLANANAFYSTPMSDSTYTGTFGSIYVPASLVASYQAKANWSVYSSRIVAYTE